MADLRIETLDGRTRYAPGDTIEGVAGWEVHDDAVKRAALRLFWRTEGKGTQDMGLGEEITFDAPGATDARTFRLTAPIGPWSYDGTLVAIVWALELCVDKDVQTLGLELHP